MKKIAVIVNPIAGRGKAGAVAEELRSIVGAVILDGPGDPNTASADAMIVVGGDGTARAAVSGCVKLGTQIPPILFIPMGTANLLARHFKLHWPETGLAQAVGNVIAANKIAHLDAARANGEIFLLMAGIGIDAMIVHEVSKHRQGPISKGHYLLPAAKALFKYPFAPITVTVDDQRLFASAPAMAFVANVAEYGTGFPLVTHARPDDGLLDVYVVPVNSRFQVIEELALAAAGAHLGSEAVAYARGKKIRIESGQPVPVQLDGDPGGHTPLDIEVLPKFVRFFIP